MEIFGALQIRPAVTVVLRRRYITGSIDKFPEPGIGHFISIYIKRIKGYLVHRTPASFTGPIGKMLAAATIRVIARAIACLFIIFIIT